MKMGAIRLRWRQLCVAAALTVVTSATHALGQTMQVYPVRSAPLGSPAGTIGDPVTPQFNAGLGCWEVEVSPGVEVDIALQAFGWGDAPGSPVLGPLAGMIVSAGYNNSVGSILNPKGWPESPFDGTYQPSSSCEGGGGNGLPCVSPFDPTCAQQGGGTCVSPSPTWICTCTESLNALLANTLDYVWAHDPIPDGCEVDDGTIRTFGGLILEVPLDALGTYVIALNPDPNDSYMTDGPGNPIPVDTFTPACITVVDNGEPGRCCSNIGPNVVCEEVTPQVCSTRPEPRSFAAGETCDGASACPTCVSDADCDDGESCTTDSCGASGQCVHTPTCPEMRFYPFRMAPLGSPAGTVGYSVTPEFNDSLGCWELQVLPGVEVDLDLQVGGWGHVAGNPTLGSLQATVLSAGYSNGMGSDLNPKGWPNDPGQGVYQATVYCGGGGDHSPCVPPFDVGCNSSTNGICVANPDWVFTPSMNANDISVIFASVLDYGWAAAAQDPVNAFDPDPSSFGTLGGLILEVPHDAAGTYLIAIDPDPNVTFMYNGAGARIPGPILTPACITVAAAEPVKNRYLTFVPHESGPVAYKLDMVSSLFHPDAMVTCWVGAPDANAIASLEPAPVTRDWTEPVVHITGCEITPGAEFELRASTDGGTTFSPPVTLQTTPQPGGVKWWGDVVGFFNGTFWTPPQGNVNIDDVLAAIRTFQHADGAPGIPRTDVEPQEPNRVVNFNDAYIINLAFRGKTYPFGCPDDPCQDNLTNPCP